MKIQFQEPGSQMNFLTKIHNSEGRSVGGGQEKKKDSCLSDAPIVVLVVGTDKRPVSQASELLVGVGLKFLYWAAIIQTQESIKPH